MALFTACKFVESIPWIALRTVILAFKAGMMSMWITLKTAEYSFTGAFFVVRKTLDLVIHYFFPVKPEKHIRFNDLVNGTKDEPVPVVTETPYTRYDSICFFLVTGILCAWMYSGQFPYGIPVFIVITSRFFQSPFYKRLAQCSMCVLVTMTIHWLAGYSGLNLSMINSTWVSYVENILPQHCYRFWGDVRLKLCLAICMPWSLFDFWTEVTYPIYSVYVHLSNRTFLWLLHILMLVCVFIQVFYLQWLVVYTLPFTFILAIVLNQSLAMEDVIYLLENIRYKRDQIYPGNTLNQFVLCYSITSWGKVEKNHHGTAFQTVCNQEIRGNAGSYDALHEEWIISNMHPARTLSFSSLIDTVNRIFLGMPKDDEGFLILHANGHSNPFKLHQKIQSVFARFLLYNFLNSFFLTWVSFCMIFACILAYLVMQTISLFSADFMYFFTDSSMLVYFAYIILLVIIVAVTFMHLMYKTPSFGYVFFLVIMLICLAKQMHFIFTVDKAMDQPDRRWYVTPCHTDFVLDVQGECHSRDFTFCDDTRYCTVFTRKKAVFDKWVSQTKEGYFVIGDMRMPADLYESAKQGNNCSATKQINAKQAEFLPQNVSLVDLKDCVTRVTDMGIFSYIEETGQDYQFLYSNASRLYKKVQERVENKNKMSFDIDAYLQIKDQLEDGLVNNVQELFMQGAELFSLTYEGEGAAQKTKDTLNNLITKDIYNDLHFEAFKYFHGANSTGGAALAF